MEECSEHERTDRRYTSMVEKHLGEERMNLKKQYDLIKVRSCWATGTDIPCAYGKAGSRAPRF